MMLRYCTINATCTGETPEEAFAADVLPLLAPGTEWTLQEMSRLDSHAFDPADQDWWEINATIRPPRTLEETA